MYALDIVWTISEKWANVTKNTKNDRGKRAH